LIPRSYRRSRRRRGSFNTLKQEQTFCRTAVLAGVSDRGNPSAVPEEAIARWDETGVVRILGHVDDMTRLMRTVDLVVLSISSCREGIPRGLIEAAAMGLPVITTDGCTRVPGGRGRRGHRIPGSHRRCGGIKRQDRVPAQRSGCMPTVRCRRAQEGKVLEEFDERIGLPQDLCHLSGIGDLIRLDFCCFEI